jgi:hypothetical protein
MYHTGEQAVFDGRLGSQAVPPLPFILQILHHVALLEDVACERALQLLNVGACGSRVLDIHLNASSVKPAEEHVLGHD